jgi:hypothetical protein
MEYGIGIIRMATYTKTGNRLTRIEEFSLFEERGLMVMLRRL